VISLGLKMINIYSPENEVELIFLKSILDGENITYYVQNDHFGSLKIGPRIDLFNAKNIFVHENDFDRAKELVADFLSLKKAGTANEHQEKYSLFDKLRMIIEALLFGWIMPGKRKTRNLEE
jgi:hypothetical protein